jgi:hypothetical protein
MYKSVRNTGAKKDNLPKHQSREKRLQATSTGNGNEPENPESV